MTAIKDIMDLVTQLRDRVKDRKFAVEITQIQSLVSAVQLENSSTISENLDLKTENFELKKKVAELESKVVTLKKENSELIQKNTEEIATLNQKYREKIKQLSQSNDSDKTKIPWGKGFT